MRKSIFDIAAQNIHMSDEVDRLLKMFQRENVLCEQGIFNYNLLKYVDTNCFRIWKHRGHFIDADDFLNSIDFDGLKENAKTDVESLLSLIELIYNFWFLSEQRLLDDDSNNGALRWCGNYYHLKDVMDDILEQYNYIAHIDEIDEKVLVVEDKPEVTAAVEIVPEELAEKIIKYNHRALKGELEVKKQILISLGAELEPKRKELRHVDSKLEDSIFFMLNNVNIRHNNRSKKDKSKYNEYVAKMTKVQLEKWYDELYQMILLAFLQIDNVDRLGKVKELKEKIAGSSN